MPTKKTAAAPDNVWDTPQAVAPTTDKATKTITPKEEPQTPPKVEFDLEGLMTDFPTATELERFVYDQTGVTLNLKGRANKLKYQVSMDVLNGVEVDPIFLGSSNPYLDKTEMVPEEPLKEKPARDKSLPEYDTLQNEFVSRFVPHPVESFRARDCKVDTVFRKYSNGMISYEVLGPLEQQPHGEKVDKFGRLRPEIIKWVDPRTGEQVVVRADGTLTPQGRNLRAMMQKLRINNSNWWDTWVDRDFVEFTGGELQNPWAE